MSYCCFFLQTVTFQCILATDGTNSFVFFLYGDGEINSDFFHRAQVGLNAGNGVDFFSVNGSLTSDVFNIDQDSNVGCPGVFVFQVNGGVQQPKSGRNGKLYLNNVKFYKYKCTIIQNFLFSQVLPTTTH